MVLDPVTALGVASGVCQLVDFAAKIISDTHEIYRDGSGSLIKRLQLETAAETVTQLSSDLLKSLNAATSPRYASPTEMMLREKCEAVVKEVSKLEAILDKIAAGSNYSKTWSSFREAIAMMWNEDKIDEINRSLKKLRGEIDSMVLVLIRNRIDDIVIYQKSMSKQLKTMAHDTKTSQQDIASQIASFTQQNEVWKMQLINAIHSQNIQPYLDDGDRRKVNYGDIDKFGKKLGAGASMERRSNLKRRLAGRLQFPAMRDRQNRVVAAHRHTFKWVFDNSQQNTRYCSDFSRWLEHDDGVFWITGKPASGKSTLMKFIQENGLTNQYLRRWAGKGNRLITCTYFFWKAGHPMQKTQTGLLQTLLYDAARSRPDWVPTLFPQRWENVQLFGDDLEPWSWSELEMAFNELVELVSGETRTRIFFMIDGLDECADDHEELVMLLQHAATSTNNIKILLGSRPEQTFMDNFVSCPNLRMQDLTYPDIVAFIDTELCSEKQFLNFKASQPQYAAELVNKIAKKASGVFLWVTLVVRSLVDGLRKGDRIFELEKRFAKIPPELDELYSSMLGGLDPEYLSHASSIFQMVQASSQQLNLLDLFFADDEHSNTPANSRLMPLSPEEVERYYDVAQRRLNSRCKGLLEVSDWTTVEEFVDPLTESLANTTIDYDDGMDVVEDFTTPTTAPLQFQPIMTNQTFQDGTCLPNGPQVSYANHLHPQAPMASVPAKRMSEQPSIKSAYFRREHSYRPFKSSRYRERDEVQHMNDFYTEKMMNRSRYRLRDGSYYVREQLKTVASLKSLYRKDHQDALLSRAAKTDGFELKSVLKVEYLHRTAQDFVERPVNWKMLLDASDESFNPQIALLKSSVLLLGRLPTHDLTVIKLWAWIKWCLQCARDAADADFEIVNKWLMQLSDTAAKLVAIPRQDGTNLLQWHHQESSRVLGADLENPYEPNDKVPPNYHWANTEPGRYGLGASLTTLCIQHDLLPFLAAATQEKGQTFRGQHDSQGRPLLDYLWLKSSTNPSDEHPPSLPMFTDQDPSQNSKQPCPDLRVITALLSGGADPNEWYQNGTPWTRLLESMQENLTDDILHENWKAPAFQQWYDIFVVFVEHGADPKADMNATSGSYVRDVFARWNLDKTRTLQRLMKTKQRKLPQWGKKLFSK